MNTRYSARVWADDPPAAAGDIGTVRIARTDQREVGLFVEVEGVEMASAYITVPTARLLLADLAEALEAQHGPAAEREAVVEALTGVVEACERLLRERGDPRAERLRAALNGS